MKPCPFCGLKVLNVCSSMAELKSFVVCTNCFAQGPRISEWGDKEGARAVAVHDWNKRYESGEVIMFGGPFDGHKMPCAAGPELLVAASSKLGEWTFHTYVLKNGHYVHVEGE